MIRFAKGLGQLAAGVLPKTLGSAAMEVLPDVGFAALTAASQGLPAGAEDLTLSLLGSYGGRVGGEALARLTGNRNRSEAFQSAGGLVGGMLLPTFGPRPILDAKLRGEQEKLAQEQAAREEAIYQEGLRAAGASLQPPLAAAAAAPPLAGYGTELTPELFLRSYLNG